MNDFEGLLPTDYGFKPQGKSAPMAASNPSPATTAHHDLGSRGYSRSTKNSNSFIGSFPNDGDSIFVSTNSKKNQNSGGLDDFLGGSGKFKNKLESHQGDTDFNFDSMFRGSSNTSAQSMNPPIYDQPVYDDDIFDGVPGLKSSSKVKYDDVFVSSSAQSKRNAAFDDLLGGFGKTESESNTTSGIKIERDEKSVPSFDDLLPGFGGSSSPGDRTTSESKWSSEPTVPKTKSKPLEDPYTVSGNFTDPAEEVNKLGSFGSAKINSTKAANTRIFEDVDPFAGLGKPVPAFKSDENNKKKDRSPSRADLSSSGSQSSSNKKTEKTSLVRSPERYKPKKSVEYDRQSDQTLFDIPTSSSDSQKFAPHSVSPPSYASTGSKDTNFQGNASPMFVDNLDESEDVWLTVSEIPLFTQPTSAPPPSRPPPPIPGQVPKSGTGPSSFTYSKGKANDYHSFPNSTSHFQASKPTTTSVKASDVSPLDEFEDFAMGANQSNVDEHANGLSNEEFEMNSAAAAMKEAMDRAEAKFRYAREVREREGTKTARSKESVQLDKDEKLVQDERARRQERIDRERLEREREEEREKQRIERERERAREVEKEREEKEREQRRLEKARELEIEREKARQAVERATREARERAAADARLRAERAAVDKANAEARERAERVAVQRVQAEARERAAAEARERAEKAAGEARERKNLEAKEREARERAASAKAEAEIRARAERAAVERAAVEARERAAAAAAATAASARTNQQRTENDFESFFSMGSRASSAPRHRDASSDNFFDPPQPQRRYEPETAKTTSVPTANIRKTSSTTNIVDDLSSIFGAAPSSGDFQEVEGESDERRRVRIERQQRTQERAAKALAEKNQRDLQIQREQAERHRIAETLDVEIKRWAAGKEGNLRALLSTLQYVLWPECGWQPVSLTDLITGAAVKKVYRKATLCIHPDKVQQKGANLQQKYVAEKVFDILKEAWNKFNSEELF